jgi:hypothetical protein
MAEIEADQLRNTVQETYGGSAELAESVRVRENFPGKVVWDGVVHVFDLVGHPTATRAYAWSSPIAGSDKRQSFAALHTTQINSPQGAVRASIVSEARAGGNFDR